MGVPNGGYLRAGRQIVQPVLEMRQLAQWNDLRVSLVTHRTLHGRRELERDVLRGSPADVANDNFDGAAVTVLCGDQYVGAFVGGATLAHLAQGVTVDHDLPG